jgi:hypothetical protein
MRVRLWIKVILFGPACAVILSGVSLLIDEMIRPDREILLFDLKCLVHLIVALVAAVSGVIVSLAVLISRSRSISLVIALVMGLTISIGLIKGAADLYSRTDYFDAPMFYADVVQIFLNLLIFPGVCVLIWKVFGKDLLAAR